MSKVILKFSVGECEYTLVLEIQQILFFFFTVFLLTSFLLLFFSGFTEK